VRLINAEGIAHLKHGSRGDNPENYRLCILCPRPNFNATRIDSLLLHQIGLGVHCSQSGNLGWLCLTLLFGNALSCTVVAHDDCRGIGIGSQGIGIAVGRYFWLRYQDGSAASCRQKNPGRRRTCVRQAAVAAE
jgi:hypothetical protein